MLPSLDGPGNSKWCMPPGYSYASAAAFEATENKLSKCFPGQEPETWDISPACKKVLEDFYEGLTGCASCGTTDFIMAVDQQHCAQYGNPATCKNAGPAPAVGAAPIGPNAASIPRSELAGAPTAAEEDDGHEGHDHGEGEHDDKEGDAEAPSEGEGEVASSGFKAIAAGATAVGSVAIGVLMAL